ncbi:protein-export membrane protein SecD, partial [Chlamydia psittaci 02DC14]
VRTH